MDLKKDYFNSSGCRMNILQIVKCEPEWAANRIQEGEKATEELAKLKYDMGIFCAYCGALITPAARRSER